MKAIGSQLARKVLVALGGVVYIGSILTGDTSMRKRSDPRLFTSINEAAQHISIVTLTFLAVCVYVGVTIAATTHEILFLGKNIGLPLFDVEVSLYSFYLLAPTLLAFLHIHLLILEYLLQGKINTYIGDDNDWHEETDLFFSSLPISILLGRGHPRPVRLVLRLLLLSITVIGPLGLLIAAQIRFLPYHSMVVTGWHAFIIIVDAFVLCYFLLLKWKFRLLPNRLISVVELVFSFAIIVCTVLCLTLVAFEIKLGEMRYLRGFLYISLADRVLLAESPPGGILSPRNVKGVQLAERINLRGADFTGSVLINADFRGVDLTGAVFKDADLRGAKFSRRRISLGPFRKASWEYEDANLDQRVTILSKADFEGALLDGAEFSFADLRGASFKDSKLRGAILSDADLTGANLKGAELHGSDLARADLRGASFIEAKAIGANFNGAKAFGANFQESFLYLATGLTFEGITLLKAKLGDVMPFCREDSLRIPKLTDLRFVDFQPLSDEVWASVVKPSGNCKEDPVCAGVLLSLEDLRSKGIRNCLIGVEAGSEEKLPVADQISKANLLYSESQLSGPLADWPLPNLGQGSFYEILAEALLKESCSDKDLADALIREISGDSRLGRPFLVHEVARAILKKKDPCNILDSLTARQRAAIEKEALKILNSPGNLDRK